MAQSYYELNEELHKQMQNYANESPDVMESFIKMHEVNAREGALSTKIKELMALSIGICVRCDGCIAFHVNDAIQAGATHQEIVETIGVAVLMGGGPSVVYGINALKALKEFEARKVVTA